MTDSVTSSASSVFQKITPLLVLVVYLAVAGLLYAHILEMPLESEDVSWSRWFNHGFGHRVVPMYLMSLLGPYVLEDQFFTFHLPSILFHVGNAWLISRLLPLLLSVFNVAGAFSSFTLRIGGYLAGLLFVCFHSLTLAYTAALSYEVVTFFTLLTTLLALEFLRRPGHLLWLFTTASCLLACLSHEYALLLPAFILALELLWRRSTAAAGLPDPLKLAIPRYLALFLLPVVVTLACAQDTFQRGAEGLVRDAGPWMALQVFSRSLVMGLLNLSSQTLKLPSLQASASQYAETPYGLLEIFVLAACALLLLELIRQILRRSLRPWMLAMVFTCCWSGLSLLPSVAAEAGGIPPFQSHRLYFLAAGQVILVATFLLYLLRYLQRVPVGSRRTPLIAAALAFATALPLAGIPQNRQRLGTLLSGGVQLNRPSPWQSSVDCGRLERLPIESVKKQLDRRLRCKDLRGLDLSGLDLSRADLSGSDLSRARLIQTNLRGARLVGAKLLWADIRESNLQDADLSRSYLVMSTLVDVNLTAARLVGARMRHARLRRVTLDRADLSRAEMDLATFHEFSARHALMKGARLHRTAIAEVSLLSADLRHAVLSECQFHRVDLRSADLRYTDLWECQYRQSDLGSADLRHAKFRRTEFIEGSSIQDSRICSRDRPEIIGAPKGSPIWVDCP